MLTNLPEKCPGSLAHPDEPDTCPVCDFVWVNVHFRLMTPTHGLVSDQQQQKALEWAAKTSQYTV